MRLMPMHKLAPKNLLVISQERNRCVCAYVIRSLEHLETEIGRMKGCDRLEEKWMVK